MKSSLLPVKPGTRSAVPRGSGTSSALSRTAKDPRSVATPLWVTPAGGVRKGGMLTPGRIGCLEMTETLTHSRPTHAEEPT